jgi:hypothetical protein
LIARGAIKKPDGQHKEKVQHVEFTGSFEAEDEKSRTEMINSKTTMTFSILAIAAVVLLFGSQQASQLGWKRLSRLRRLRTLPRTLRTL